MKRYTVPYTHMHAHTCAHVYTHACTHVCAWEADRRTRECGRVHGREDWWEAKCATRRNREDKDTMGGHIRCEDGSSG